MLYVMVFFIFLSSIIGYAIGVRKRPERIVFRDSTVIDPESVEPFARVLRILDRLDLHFQAKIEVTLDDEGAYVVEVLHKKYRGATLGVALCEAEAFFRKTLEDKRARINKAV